MLIVTIYELNCAELPLHAMKDIFYRYFVLLVLISGCSSSVQNDFDGCPIEGDNPRLAVEDRLKNRFDIPANYAPIDFSKMAAMTSTDSADEHVAVQLKGYVIEVKDGGPETCNCHAQQEKDYDIHIVLSNDENDLEKKHGSDQKKNG